MDLQESQEHLTEARMEKHEIGGFFLSEAVFPPQLSLFKHDHARASFCVALAGGCSETYSNRTRDYVPFTLEYLPANEEHSLSVHRTGMRSFSCEFESHWLESLHHYAPIMNNSVHFKGGALSLLLVRLYQEFRHADELSPLVIEGLALEMLGEASRHLMKVEQGDLPAWLKQAEELARARFAEPLGLSFISNIVGVHPVRLAREFRKHYHLTVGEYLRQLRIEYVTHELATSHTPLSELATSAGFSDQSHLTRTFKRHTGMSPSKYRALLRAH